MSEKKYCCECFGEAVEGHVDEMGKDEAPLIIKVNAEPDMTWYEINEWAITYCPFCGVKLEEKK